MKAIPTDDFSACFEDWRKRWHNVGRCRFRRIQIFHFITIFSLLFDHSSICHIIGEKRVYHFMKHLSIKCVLSIMALGC